jgi:gliding motility-associated protein GldC
MKNSEIKFTIGLDNNNVPEKINWEATDSGIEGNKECKSIMVSVWDAADNTTMRIDLWTKEMLIDDMKRFFYENMMSMADTYQRATNDAENADEMRKFADSFAKKTDLFKKQ